MEAGEAALEAEEEEQVAAMEGVEAEMGMDASGVERG